MFCRHEPPAVQTDASPTLPNDLGEAVQVMMECIQRNAAHEVEECAKFRDEMRFVYYQKRFEEYWVRYASASMHTGNFILEDFNYA